MGHRHLKMENAQLKIIIIEPAHYKTYKMACAPSEDSDQPGHPHEESLGP